MKPSKKILITGHAGFIGGHLTQKLLSIGYQVAGVDNYNDFYSPTIKVQHVDEFRRHRNFSEFKTDILEINELAGCFKKFHPEIIIHLAARAGVRPSLANPQLYHQVNVAGTANLLQLAQKYQIRQFIFAGSSSVYGNQTKIPFSETDRITQPVSPYAETKLTGEALCLDSNIPMTVLRFFTVYGPWGRPDMAPYLFIQKILNHEPIIRFGDGTTSRDYTYIDDIINGIVATIGKAWQFEIINLGNNHPVTLNDFIDTLEKITSKTAKIIQKPRHPADVPQTFADISKAKKLLNWQPTTDLIIGMTKFIDWYQQTHQKR